MKEKLVQKEGEAAMLASINKQVNFFKILQIVQVLASINKQVTVLWRDFYSLTVFINVLTQTHNSKFGRYAIHP